MWERVVLAVGLGLVSMAAGCATTQPWQPSRLERGVRVEPLDELADGLAIVDQLIYWNEQLENHDVSAQTLEAMQQYMASYAEELSGVMVRVNQWKPHGDLWRLVTNHHVAWPYRLLIGFPVTLGEALIPGRLFPAWVNQVLAITLLPIPTGAGDHYNPYTNTIHLYSDDPAVALHELGHATDFLTRSYTGTYAFARAVPLLGYFVAIYQEAKATGHAVDYLITQGERETELHAYKALYPPLGGYIAWLPGVLGGHVWGRVKAADRRRYYTRNATTPSMVERIPLE